MCIHVSVPGNMHAPAVAYGGQKRESHLPELELHGAVILSLWVLGTEFQSYARATELQPHTFIFINLFLHICILLSLRTSLFFVSFLFHVLFYYIQYDSNIIIMKC